MLNVTIKNKSYYPITTIIDGRTIKFPSKGKELKLQITKITDHMNELIQNNLIQVVQK